MTRDRRTTWFVLPLILLACVIAFVFSPAGYRPDRPVATIVPGSSSGPTFVAQIIRPRLGLPLGGVLPPQLFGIDAELQIASTSPGASIGSVGPERIELSANGWRVVLVLDEEARVSPDTTAEFELVFEERKRRVRCRPAESAIGIVELTPLAESEELSGHFHIELARCEYAESGDAFDWAPDPLVLHGSFDRLPLRAGGAEPKAVGPAGAD